VKVVDPSAKLSSLFNLAAGEDMAYDEGLAKRLREIFSRRNDITEKKMFGGVAFMLRGNMACGILGDILMARVGPEQYAAALKKPHTHDKAGNMRPMKGFVYIEAAGIESDNSLKNWVMLCEKFVGALPPK
jgi:TfoX/Sxy family transcriptional regulator of competence genes